MPHKEFKTRDQLTRRDDAFTTSSFNKRGHARAEALARMREMKGMDRSFPRQRSKFEDVPGIKTRKRPLSDVAKERDLFDK